MMKTENELLRDMKYTSEKLKTDELYTVQKINGSYYVMVSRDENKLYLPKKTALAFAGKLNKCLRCKND